MKNAKDFSEIAYSPAVDHILSLVDRIDNYTENDPVRQDVLGDFKEGMLGNAVVDFLRKSKIGEVIETDFGFQAGSIRIDHEGIFDIETGEVRWF